MGTMVQRRTTNNTNVPVTNKITNRVQQQQQQRNQFNKMRNVGMWVTQTNEQCNNNKRQRGNNAQIGSNETRQSTGGKRSKLGT